MHELSIAMSIVESVEKEAKKQNAVRITDIDLEIGALAGVVVDALNFALEVAVKDTVLEHSQINIIQKSGRARCMDCHLLFDIEEYFTPCPSCNGYKTEILQGEELNIKSIKMEV